MIYIIVIRKQMERCQQARENLYSLMAKSNMNSNRSRFNSSRNSPFSKTPYANSSRLRSPNNERDYSSSNNQFNNAYHSTQQKIMSIMNNLSPRSKLPNERFIPSKSQLYNYID